MAHAHANPSPRVCVFPEVDQRHPRVARYRQGPGHQRGPPPLRERDGGVRFSAGVGEHCSATGPPPSPSSQALALSHSAALTATSGRCSSCACSAAHSTPRRGLAGRFGARTSSCGALAFPTQSCHREHAEPVRGNRAAAPGAASVAAPLNPAQGYIDVAKHRPCRSPERAVDLGPRGIGFRVRGGRVQLLQLVDPEASLRPQRRSGGRDELGGRRTR
jgi:hypothetical protein